MFTCANCGRQKSDDERGSVGWPGNIRFLLLLKFTRWPSEVCKDCSRSVRLFGFICLLVTFIIGLICAFGKRLL